MTLVRNQLGKLVRNTDGLISKVSRCCCLCSCVGGKDVDVEISGVADGTCSECESLNQTYMFPSVVYNPDPIIGLGLCDVQEKLEEVVDPCGVFGPSWDLIFDITVFSESDVWISVQFALPGSGIVVLAFRKIADTAGEVDQLFEDLCAGTAIDVPFDSASSSSECNGSSATCTVTINIV